MNGSNERQQESSVPSGEALKDEQSLADEDQTLADADQTLADSDQTLSDADQSNAESDQVAADRDQAASDRDLESGVDPTDHEISREIRERTARQREQTSSARFDIAVKRDASAQVRDLAALVRDRGAQARDAAMAQRDHAFEQHDGNGATNGAIAINAAERLKRSTEHRAQAAQHRGLAAQDREAAARDRDEAAADRSQAATDREAFVRQLVSAETDSLTGARTRAAGLTQLDHELNRCRRTDGRLVVTYVDVVGLKSVNDTEGHAAGDELLKRVMEHIRNHLRSYDLIIRLGGDEFLCAMSAMTLPDARQRFSTIAAALAAAPDTGAIRTGFAELAPDETAQELIARADSELVAIKRRG